MIAPSSRLPVRRRIGLLCDEGIGHQGAVRWTQTIGDEGSNIETVLYNYQKGAQP
jgi:hypothetical protein